MPVRVIVRSVGDRVEFNVIDAGGGFERAGNGQRHEPDGEALLENGIGLQIIQALFPDTDVGPNAEGGTTVRFSAARSGERP